jgi:hypothetical protein
VGYHKDEILKAWDETILKVAQHVDDATDAEIAAASAKVCAKLPGLTSADITAALRPGVEEERRTITVAEHVRQELEAMVREREQNAGPLPGLPGGTSLKR